MLKMGQSTRALVLSIAKLTLCANATVMSLDAEAILKRDPPTAIPGCATDVDRKWQPGKYPLPEKPVKNCEYTYMFTKLYTSV
jgi:hypothetical protein